MIMDVDKLVNKIDKDFNDVVVARIDDLYDKLYAVECLVKSVEQTVYEIKGEMHDDKY
jgi:hypothetical protein